MTIIVADHTPPAIRGLLKRWFIEPRPNIFVGTVNARTREKTLAYIRRNAPGLGMLVLFDDASTQGFSVQQIGQTKRQPVSYCGLTLIAEKWVDTPEAVAPPPDSTDADGIAEFDPFDPENDPYFNSTAATIAPESSADAASS